MFLGFPTETLQENLGNTYCMSAKKKTTKKNSAQQFLLVRAQKSLCTKLIGVVHLAAHNTFVLCIDLGVEAFCAQRFAHNSAHNVLLMRTTAHKACAQLCAQRSAASCVQPVRTTDARLHTKNLFGNLLTISWSFMDFRECVCVCEKSAREWFLWI